MEADVSFAIVRGRPTAEELAAVTAVLLARLRSAAGQEGAVEEEGGSFGAAPRRAGWGGGRPRRRPPVGWSRR